MGESTNAATRHPGVREALLMRRTDLTRRLEAIRADRRREHGALDPDWEDQAIQRENDEALDALDRSEREELAATEAALERLSNGTYGVCVRCDGQIEADRLKAVPAAATCVACR